MQTIRARELKTMMDRRDDLTVINVLDREAFDEEHIPGSVNVPLDDDEFLASVEELAGGTDETVVVYCASRDCQASPKAARRLTAHGFTDVIDFEGGMAEWKLADFGVASGAGTEAVA